MNASCDAYAISFDSSVPANAVISFLARMRTEGYYLSNNISGAAERSCKGLVRLSFEREDGKVLSSIPRQLSTGKILRGVGAFFKVSDIIEAFCSDWNSRSSSYYLCSDIEDVTTCQYILTVRSMLGTI